MTAQLLQMLAFPVAALVVGVSVLQYARWAHRKAR